MCHRSACCDGVQGTRVIRAMFGLPAATTIFSPACPLLWLMNAGCFTDLSARPRGLKLPSQAKPVDGRL